MLFVLGSRCVFGSKAPACSRAAFFHSPFWGVVFQGICLLISAQACRFPFLSANFLPFPAFTSFLESCHEFCLVLLSIFIFILFCHWDLGRFFVSLFFLISHITSHFPGGLKKINKQSVPISPLPKKCCFSPFLVP